MGEDLREDLAAALQSAETGAGDVSGQAADLAAEADPIAGKPAGEEADQGAAAEAGEGRERDASGRFAPKKAEQVPADQQQAAQEPVKPAAAAPGAPAAAPAVQTIKPPASWTPEARETWSQMRPEHQAEVSRREREITDALQHTVEARRTTQELNEIVSPYAMLMQSEGVTPMQAIASNMRTAALFRIGTPQQKAQMTAALIKQFNVPIEALDELLAGQPPSGAASAPATEQLIQDAVNRALQPFVAQARSTQQAQDQEATNAAKSELEVFANDPANEFFLDVAQDMADLLALATKRGQLLPLSEAYRRATMAHPSISKVLEGRARNGAAAQQTAAASRARKAAASVSSTGAPSRTDDATAEADDPRSAILASVAELSRRNP